MNAKRFWTGLLAAALFTGGATVSTMGCDMLKGDKDEETDDDEDDDKKKKKKDDDDDPPPEDTSAVDTGPGDVVLTKPNMIKTGGSFRAIRPITVYRDTSAVQGMRIGGVTPGTVIQRKAEVSNWWLIDWPRGVGQMAPGWILVGHREKEIVKNLYERDAGTPEVPDAGKPATVDAGPQGWSPKLLKTPK